MLQKLKNNKKEVDYEQLGKMLVSIYETGYINKAKMYRMSFIKGVLAGFGGVIGATVLVALFLWLLSLASGISLIDTLRDTISNSQP